MQNPLVYKNIMFYLERQVRIRGRGEGGTRRRVDDFLEKLFCFLMNRSDTALDVVAGKSAETSCPFTRSHVPPVVAFFHHEHYVAFSKFQFVTVLWLIVV
jgi:hypothetical protein